MASDDIVNTLGSELQALDGIHAQDIETGSNNVRSALGNYTNKLFGAPYQLLDSVDRRFPSINSNVGSEYLRNFLLHSPILHIKPGMPRYTGGDDPSSVFRQMQNAYIGSSTENSSLSQSLITALAQKNIFSAGSRLQRRMFGIRPTYNEYMMYVNYMCRSVAILLGLTDSKKNTGLPNGTFLNDMKFSRFESIRWENYRMMGNSYVDSSVEHLTKFKTAAGITASGETVSASLQYVNPLGEDFFSNDSFANKVTSAWDEAMNTSFADVISGRIQSLMLMVEPVSFTENLNNDTGSSFIEGAIDGITDSIGSEIAFVTGSKVDTGILGKFASFMGSGMESISMNLGKIVESGTGGFATNLFSGAIQALKGQKMIYPEIYKTSKSTMDYEYSMTLTTPYGDIYNYYMNIVVPLMHLIALATPRMITSNSVASPFLVQSYIPGICTCQMGIVSNMTIVKNPSQKSVSVQGFPLTVKVTFQIKELYNALSISPAHDPASFMFNETLNDYMSNLAGLIPSMDTFSKQRASMFENLSQYFENSEWASDMAESITQEITDVFTPRT